MDDASMDRLRAVRAGFAGTRAAVEARAPWPLAETIDDSAEAEWGPPEVLAHVAEMVPYWQGEIERVLAGPQEPVPFGRIASDPLRIGILERIVRAAPSKLYDKCSSRSTASNGAGLTPAEKRSTRPPPDPWRDDRQRDAGALRHRPPGRPSSSSGHPRRRSRAADASRCSSVRDPIG
jgi:hypothetical protein